MLCKKLSPAVQQVWPGSGVDTFRFVTTNGVRIAVVSTFSKFLNFERWYIASPPDAKSWGKTLELDAPPSTLPLQSPHCDTYSESYVDRAVLSPFNWRFFTAPGASSALSASVPDSLIYTAELKPVFMDLASWPARLTFSECIKVWVQFILSDGALGQMAWYFEKDLDHLPSGFEVPERARFELASELPTKGWTYAGGMRPAPWPG